MRHLLKLSKALAAILATSPIAYCQVGDECINALPTGAGGASSNVGYTNSPEPWGPYNAGQSDIWWVLTPSVTQSYSISACNIGQYVDTVLIVYEGSCGQLTYVDGDDDSCGHQGVGARVDTVMNAGQTYYFRVGTYGSPGTFSFGITSGIGSLQQVGSPGCGAASLAFHGVPGTGEVLSTTVENTIGTALVGAGLTVLNQPFCGCFIGHEWLAWTTGPTWHFWIPPNLSLIGLEFYVQGADITALTSCPATGVSMTTPYRVTIG